MGRWAMHLPNGPLESDDIERILATGCLDVVDLDLFAGRWPMLKAASGNLRVHARCYARGALGDPIAEARAFANVVRAHPEPVSWRWRNESNLEANGAMSAPWADWLAVFGQAAGRLGVATGLFAPAVSPGTPDWLAWLDATITGARAGGYDGIDGHIYGTPAEVGAVLAEYRQRWQGRLIVTEYNFGTGREYDLNRWAWDLAEVDALVRQYNVEVVCPFIWRWHNPDVALPTPVDIRGTPVEAALRAIAAASPATPAPTPPAGALAGPDPRWGAGFTRAESLVGPWREAEVWHWPGREWETSLAIGHRGYAVWSRADNRTVVVVNLRHGGAVYDDLGNSGDGTFKRLH